jgi:hypothetical protein
MTKPPGDYDIGYKRPPLGTRFKPGFSGNAKGRPKGVRNLETDLKEELSERISVREGERQLKVSKQRALVKTLLAKALKGDTRAANILLQLIAKTVVDDEAGRDAVQDLADDDVAILQRYLERRLVAPK